MALQAVENACHVRQMIATCIRTALLLAALVGGSLLPERPAFASATFEAAAQTANGGLNACASNRGKELYNCVANVLDRMSSDIASVGAGSAQTRSILQTAAAGLRAAINKAQAMSAITQCRSAIAGALRQAKATGGGAGLAAISGTLARAAQLIQSKG